MQIRLSDCLLIGKFLSEARRAQAAEMRADNRDQAALFSLVEPALAAHRRELPASLTLGTGSCAHGFVNRTVAVSVALVPGSGSARSHGRAQTAAEPVSVLLRVRGLPGHLRTN